MRRYNGVFPQLNVHIKGYEKSQQEYAKIQAKIDKLREKGDTGQNIVKMHNVSPQKFDYKKRERERICIIVYQKLCVLT